MFEIELFQLLNQYKEATDSFTKNQIESSICTLVNQNPQEFEKLEEKGTLDPQTLEFLKNCINQQKNSQEQNDQNSNNYNNAVEENKEKSNYQVIKEFYDKWLEIYLRDNKELTGEEEKVADELLNYFLPGKANIILEILKIQDTQDYEVFKTMLKNKLRKYYVNKIREYRKSEKFTNLNIFKKVKKRREINQVYKELGEYLFKPEKIEEIIK